MADTLAQLSIAVYPVRIERGSLQNFQGSRTILQFIQLGLKDSLVESTF